MAEKEAVARAIYETLGFSYADRPTGTPYGAWFTALQAADAVLAALSPGSTVSAEGWRDVLNLYREAVRIDIKMEGPQFMGADSSALRRAWNADRAMLNAAGGRDE